MDQTPISSPPTLTRSSFSKFKRCPEQYPFQVTQRDLEILHLVYDYRFIPSDHLLALIPGSKRKILDRLKNLFHHGYVDRMPDHRIRTHSGSDKMIYALTDRGAELLACEKGLEFSKVSWVAKNRAVTERHIKHTLMIARFRTTVTLVTAQSESLKLIFWKENRGSGQNIDPDLSDRVTISLGQGREERRRIVPDAFLGIEDPEYENYFYLEADRSTMTNERFAKKLRAYWTWRKEEGSLKKHGVEHFRVLTITPSYERRDNLRKISLTASPAKGGSSMFWFACEKDYSLENPASMLGAIWVTAKDGEPHSLFE